MSTSIVTVSYDELVAFSERSNSSSSDEILVLLEQKIGRAFGMGRLGILAVTEVPLLKEKRQKLLPLARRLALLPDKTEVICELSKYQTGWSHGKEIFAGKPDLAKGSFYANPLLDDITLIRNVSQHVKEENPGFFAPNVWPTQSIPEFEIAFKELGQLVVQVGRLLARLCDAHVAQQCPGYDANTLANLLDKSQFCKARLLHYFAVDRSTSSTSSHSSGAIDNDDFSDWCGWHNDHGSLTGLVPGMFLDPEGNEVSLDDDDKAGLYIQARDGSIHHVCLPPNSIGFQIGETSQIHSGGILQATPHAVRGSSGSANVTRESFAVFMEPEYDGPMELPKGMTVEDVQDACIRLPSSVKTLSSRWKPGMTFGEFSAATFSAFY